MNKSDQLADLKKRMDLDESLPLRHGATQLVFGDGNPETKIYFLGEAPGCFEDQQGKPFVGQAGKLLNQLLESINLKRGEVYISNIVRFRPPGNRDPEPDEIEAFKPYIDEEIAIIGPEVIVTLGRFSMAKFVPDSKISQIHGKLFRVEINDKWVTVIPMYHPAAALRRGEVMNQLKEDFLCLPGILNRVEKVGQVIAMEDKKHQLELFD